MSHHIIKTISEFAEEISNFPIAPGHSRFFRGHSDAKMHILEPSIYRKANAKLLQNEENAIRDAIVRCPHEFPDSTPFFEKLVKLQHYGLPTRLLDITSNALVALYFACIKQQKTEGEVIILDIPEDHVKFYDSDTVAVIANISRRNFNFDLSKLSSSKEDFNDEDEIRHLVYDIQEHKSTFTAQIIPNDLEKVLAVRAKLDNARIARQDGAFLIFGIAGQKSKYAQIPPEWIICGNKKHRITFTAKHTLERELHSFGISKQSLFPELDSQTQAIIAKYNQKYKRTKKN